MSNCITINGLENLPNEQTLLIYYNIHCTGTWYLSQLQTAYRNVCDSQWTVMYPNHQHPRHTDFPITIVNPGAVLGTFAWNYGGIQGISAENFDTYHSYLVQLSIFNYACFNTGETGVPPGTGEPPIIPIIPPGGIKTFPEPPIPPDPPDPPDPPVPPIIMPGFILDPFPGWIPEPALPGLGDPSIPGVGEPSLGQTIPVIGTPYIPTIEPGLSPAYIPPPEPILTQSQLPYIPILLPSIGSYGGGTPTTISLGSAFTPKTPVVVERPSVEEPGQIANPSLAFVSLSRSPAIPSQPGLIQGAIHPTSTPDIGTIQSSPIGDIPGGLSSSLIVPAIAGQSTLGQFSIPNLEYSALIDLQVANTEVTIGEPIVFSAVFLPPTQMTARMVVTIQDNSKSIEVVRTGLIAISDQGPLTCGASSLSSVFNLGAVTVTCLVYDVNNLLIGIQSIIVNNLEVNNTGTSLSSRPTLGMELPRAIINGSNNTLNEDYFTIDLPANESRYVVYIATTPQTSLSSVLVSSFSTEDRYTLTVLSSAGQGSILPGEIIESTLALTEVAYSDSKFKINGEEVYPYSHTVGLTDTPFPSTSLIVVEVAPAINNIEGNTEGRLYMSNNFVPRVVSAVSTDTSVTALVPFANDQFGLVIHGNQEGYIAPTSSVLSQYSNAFGTVTWNGIGLPNGYYYSIIRTRNGVLNPFSEPLFSARHTS